MYVTASLPVRVAEFLVGAFLVGAFHVGAFLVGAFLVGLFAVERRSQSKTKRLSNSSSNIIQTAGSVRIQVLTQQNSRFCENSSFNTTKQQVL